MVRGSVPSLLQGISQQTPTLRLPAYIDDGLNVYPTVLEGLIRRPASSHIAILAALNNPTAMHWIVRDDTERYFVAADEGILKVWNFAGTLQTVVAPDGWNYISEAQSLGFRTINDFTFVFDRGKTVALSSEVEGGATKEGLVWVRQGDYGVNYSLAVGYPADNPTWVGTGYTSSTTNVGEIMPDYIAATLRSGLATNAGGAWAITQVGHTIHIKRVDGADFLIRATDGATGRNIITVKDRIAQFNDLPTIATNNFHIRVDGDAATKADDWYAKFVTTDPNGGMNSGYWMECPAPGTQVSFDATTMPHILVREGDGTFTFRKADWGKRVCGDAVNFPPPSFVGRKITSVSAVKQRLALTAGGSLVGTRPADPFNFWQRSAQLLTDADPIDINPSHDRPYTLKGIGEFQKGLILMADDVQFLVTHGEVFGPKTIAAKPLSKFDLDVQDGLLGMQQDRVVCAVKRTSHTGLLTFKAPNASLADMIFDETSAVVPSLIPGRAQWIAGSATENTIVMKASGSPYLFAYKEAEDQGKIIQSAWVPWEWKNREPISGTFVGPDLVMVLKDTAGKFSMERMSLRPYARDQLTWDIHLDRRTEIVEDFFEASGGSTVVTLPWTATTGETVIMVVTEGPQAGAVVKASATGENQATFPGLYTGPAVVGVVCRSWADLSTLYWRKPADLGGLEAVVEGRLQLLRGKVSYADSGPFKVFVRPHDRSTAWATSIAVPLFEETYFAGPQDLRTGSTEFTIGALNDKVRITFDTEESPMPMRIGSFEWAGDMNLRARPL